MSFDYLIEKIKRAEFADIPFRHVYIEDFFSDEDFSAIVGSQEIAVADSSSDEQLFDILFDHGYDVIDFPGCVLDKNVYIAWRRGKIGRRNRNGTACEGFGVTLRLMKPKTEIITKVSEFMNSPDFQAVLAEKFKIPLDSVKYDCGIQKYLDGYEISPHPDTRKKALTYMVNINPSSRSEVEDHHTRYLSLLPGRRYVQAYWEGNPDIERCWLPWDWCKTEKTQTKNNSIVIFAPADDTLHAVKASYDHLKHQRTQLYGNLWYAETPAKDVLEWEDFVIRPAGRGRGLAHFRPALKSALNSAGLARVQNLLKRRRAPA